MRRTADIYDRQAVLMEGQLEMGRKQVALSNQQFELSRQEAAYTRRPHFRVRFARLADTSGPTIGAGHPVTINIEVLNNGQADAVIIRSHLEILWGNQGLPGSFPYFDSSKLNDFASKGNKNGCTMVAGGGDLDITVQSDRILGQEAFEILLGRDDWTIYLVGWIGYRRLDDGYNRFFDFALQFNARTGRFLPVENDPDYAHDPDGK